MLPLGTRGGQVLPNALGRPHRIARVRRHFQLWAAAERTGHSLDSPDQNHNQMLVLTILEISRGDEPPSQVLPVRAGSGQVLPDALGKQGTP